MAEEWAVVIVEGHALDAVATSATGAPVLKDSLQRMVGICEIGRAADWVTICDDEAEAFRVAQAVSEQLHLPLYDGVDRHVVQVDPGEYVDLEADGPDPYTEHRNVTNRWAVVLAHDERYAPTDFATIVNLDDWVYEEEYIVSQHPSEAAAYAAARDLSARFALAFPVEPGQFSADVPAIRYRAPRENSALVPGGRRDQDSQNAVRKGAGPRQFPASVRTRRGALRGGATSDRGDDR